MVSKCGTALSGSLVRRIANNEIEHRTRRSRIWNTLSEKWNGLSEKWNELSHPYPHIYFVISLLVLLRNLFIR